MKQVGIILNHLVLFLNIPVDPAPGIVKIIGVASTSNTSVNVAWIPPAPPNGIIIQYEVIYSEYNDPDSRVANSVTNNENNFIISRLGKLLLYICTSGCNVVAVYLLYFIVIQQSTLCYSTGMGGFRNFGD